MVERISFVAIGISGIPDVHRKARSDMGDEDWIMIYAQWEDFNNEGARDKELKVKMIWVPEPFKNLKTQNIIYNRLFSTLIIIRYDVHW